MLILIVPWQAIANCCSSYIGSEYVYIMYLQTTILLCRHTQCASTCLTLSMQGSGAEVNCGQKKARDTGTQSAGAQLAGKGSERHVWSMCSRAARSEILSSALRCSSSNNNPTYIYYISGPNIPKYWPVGTFLLCPIWTWLDRAVASVQIIFSSTHVVLHLCKRWIFCWQGT